MEVIPVKSLRLLMLVLLVMQVINFFLPTHERTVLLDGLVLGEVVDSQAELLQLQSRVEHHVQSRRILLLEAQSKPTAEQLDTCIISITGHIYTHIYIPVCVF